MAASRAEDAETEADAVAHAVAEPTDHLTPVEGTRGRLDCPACGSAHVAQVLGDNGGVSYVCTSCGHSWS
ncbi:hypothetical protein J7E93_03860 [Streptomyces sp. ISL-36]|uniref:hypothetical protein n=1 Tax=Streptomyces sp. ISL-36 TaxID=2819182 RepID=UPI001BEC8D01|nr:hypothetical protein [Streptomyces sp. ISL-36]MBT2439266.1 hypothetical protein [Streptomyces sp. ISL-36]